jgi:UDP-GlcNAc:undecaprenyl-phosphate/decaprenyl-phosphate GlcNAc-1-phosphate transferase
MNTLILLVVCSFLSCLMLTPVLRRIAVWLGVFDVPDLDRKLHSTPIPRIGGGAVILAYVSAFLVLQSSHLQEAVLGEFVPLLGRLLPALVVMFLVGLTDDLIGLRPYQKCAGQFLAAFLACALGLRIHSLAGFEVGNLGGVALTVLWLVGCTNAFNLIDGMDGVATGIGVVATAGAVFATLQLGDQSVALAGAPLLGGLLAFLIYNFSPATIFLGDCGSLSIGFLVACFGIHWLQKAPTVWGLAGPVMTCVVPLLDMGVAVSRRVIKGQSIFRADRSHIHHRLLDRGFSTRRVAVLLYTVSGLAAVLALGQTRSTNIGSAGLVLAFCIAVVVGVRFLEYQEFRVLAQVLRESQIFTIVQNRLSLRAFDESVRSAPDAQAVWHALLGLGRDLGLCTLTLRLAGQDFKENHDSGGSGHWDLLVPLSADEYVSVGCRLNHQRSVTLTGLMANHLHRALSTKVEELNRLPQLAVTGRASNTGTYAQVIS